MNYYNLKSLVSATKKNFAMRAPSSSFCLASKREKPYIPPNFSKAIFETERPAIILISAVGATGKTALAQVLSSETALPLLDLGKHKPVGDNTLTGLLTSTFRTEDLSEIFLGLTKGSYGVIVDGVDEGRSKTTEKAFEAFLDDIARLCAGSENTSFVLLGRTKILEDCWVYLSDKGISTGLITISSFDLVSARSYIDLYSETQESKFHAQYVETRDYILQLLSNAFSDSTTQSSDGFLSFIGYPPVLDSIVALLGEEPNYHKLLTQLRNTSSNDVEISLLHRITTYILQREKDQKVIPNIVSPLIADVPSSMQEEISKRVFGVEEQCLRLVAFCLHRPLSLQIIDEPVLNEKYEEQLLAWLQEHPFLTGTRFRNVVFEAVALATLMSLPSPDHIPMVLEYLDSHKHSYHLVYLLSIISQEGYVPIEYLRAILGSSLEFRSTNTSVELAVEGPDTDEFVSGTANIEIEIMSVKDENISKTFTFHSNVTTYSSVILGGHLSATYVSLPCHIVLTSGYDIEFTAPVEIYTDSISIEAKALTLKHAAKGNPEDSVILQVRNLRSTLENVTTNGVPLRVSTTEEGLLYPLIQFAEKRPQLPSDKLIAGKYLRLRRILMEFRSHRRGTLARFKSKIESERVLRNETGQALLRKLLADRILTAEGNFYFLHPEGINTHLGVTYIDLRLGKTSDKLVQYLQSIP